MPLVPSNCAADAPGPLAGIVQLFITQLETCAWWCHPTLNIRLFRKLLLHEGALPIAVVPLSWHSTCCGNKSPKEGMEPAAHCGTMCQGHYSFLSYRKCPLHDLWFMLSGQLCLHFLEQNKTAPKVSVFSFCFTTCLCQGLSELVCPAGINTPRASAEKAGGVEEAQGGVWAFAVDIHINQNQCIIPLDLWSRIKDKGTSVCDILLLAFMCLFPRLVRTALGISNSKCQGEKGTSFCSSTEARMDA